MKPVILCILNDKLDEKKYKYSKAILKCENFNYSHIGLGQKLVSPSYLIEREINNGRFYKNTKLLNAIEYAKNNKSRVHIIGLYDEDKELFNALLKTCEDLEAQDVYLHLIAKKTNIAKKIKNAKLANAINIEYLDDIEGIYNLLVKGKKLDKVKIAENIHVCNNDTVIFYNINDYRLNNLINAFAMESYSEFKCKKFKGLNVVTIFSHEHTKALYNLPNFKSLGECISNSNLKQLRVNTNNYELDGYKNIKYNNEKIVDGDFSDVEFAEYDFTIINLNLEELDELLNRKIDVTFLILSKYNDDEMILLSKSKYKDGNITSLAATILNVLKIDVPASMDKALKENRNSIIGDIFKVISLLFILVCAVYYVTRFLHLYITK